MSNAWNIIETDEQRDRLGPIPSDEPRCGERLVDDRCILALGHEDNHIADHRAEGVPEQ